MAAHNLKHALFCAIVTLVISYPILGFNLASEGINVTLEGAQTSTVIGVLLAAVIVFLFQLFRDKLMGSLSQLPAVSPLANREPMEQSKRLKLESTLLTLMVIGALVWPFIASRGAVDLSTLVPVSYTHLTLPTNREV